MVPQTTAAIPMRPTLRIAIETNTSTSENPASRLQGRIAAGDRRDEDAIATAIGGMTVIDPPADDASARNRMPPGEICTR